MVGESGNSGAGPFGAGAAHRMGELNLTLLRFYVEMRQGMEEFRRVYGLSTAETDEASVAEALAGRLLANDSSQASRDLEAGIQELKVHHAALLEGYNQATQDGARRLLDTLDPEQLRKDFEGSTVRVGPFPVPCRWRPLLVQAIWEEMLVRFHRYRSSDPADFERFFRDGFRKGYRQFQAGRSVGLSSAGTPEE